MRDDTGTTSERSAATGPETSFRSASSQGCPCLMLAVGHKLYSERTHRWPQAAGRSTAARSLACPPRRLAPLRPACTGRTAARRRAACSIRLSVSFASPGLPRSCKMFHLRACGKSVLPVDLFKQQLLRTVSGVQLTFEGSTASDLKPWRPSLAHWTSQTPTSCAPAHLLSPIPRNCTAAERRRTPRVQMKYFCRHWMGC